MHKLLVCKNPTEICTSPVVQTERYKTLQTSHTPHKMGNVWLNKSYKIAE